MEARRGFAGACQGGAHLKNDGGVERMRETSLQALADRAEIIDTVSRIGFAADLREWDACRACFADEVRVDYTSLNGGEPATVRSADLVDGWSRVFAGFDVTQHAITNHDVAVDGDRAVCRSHFVARHLIRDAAAGGFWNLGGHYRHELARTPAGWKVTAMTMTWTWEEGDRALVQRASERGAGE
jgi:SnoaL-like domain